MTVKDIIKDADLKMKKTIDASKREFSEVRTGRAHPGLIEGLHVNYYGTVTMLREMAAISVPDARTVVVQPWDATAIADIEKAILESHLGITPMNDGKIIRLVIPPLSEERREEMKKVVKEMAEKGKVSLRTVRRDANDHIKKLENEKKISKDDAFKGQEEIQKLTDKSIKDIDLIMEDKNKALSS